MSAVAGKKRKAASSKQRSSYVEKKKLRTRVQKLQDEYVSTSGEEDDDESKPSQPLDTERTKVKVQTQPKIVDDDLHSEDDDADAGLHMEGLDDDISGDTAFLEPGSDDGIEEDKGKSKDAKLANAIGKILAGSDTSKESKTDKNRPILSKQKHIEKSIDNEKLEAKARKLIAAEKKKKEDVGRIKPDHSTTDYEKKLRKIATRGVVKLFNAIRVAQKSAEEVKSSGPVQKSAEIAPVVSKNTFLDMIKSDTAKTSASGGKGGPIPTSGATKTGEEDNAVAWTKSDYLMKPPKHWDEEDEDDDEGEAGEQIGEFM
ncbi:hypothetical protein HDU85_007693 [Gaertneriomyces sp. JEL0708]|nr:hypothetical protein HDU85_007693 [Gaertneriomyces sp. JEL0708]